MATPILLPRGVLPPDYGERLRAAGLNEGISFGGSEIDPRDELTPEQQARLLALASGGGGPTLTNSDVARFIAQRNGGTLPGLEGVGGEGVPADSSGPTPGSAPSFNTDFSISPATGGRIGATTLGIGGGLLGALTGPAAPFASTILGGLGAYAGNKLGPSIADVINGIFAQPGTLRTTENQIPMPEDPAAVNPAPEFTAHDLAVAGSLGISDPGTQGFASSLSPTGFFDVAGRPLGQR